MTAPICDVPLTEAEIDLLTRLVRQRQMTPGMSPAMRTLHRGLLAKLDGACFAPPATSALGHAPAGDSAA